MNADENQGQTRLRQRYRTAIRAEIAHTVNSPAEVDAELQYLIEVIST